MADEAALSHMSRLDRELHGILSALDIDIISRETGRILTAIRRLSGDARLDIRDFEMADSRVEMEENAAAATKRLEQLRAQILKASEHGIFSAIDVAQLSAQVDEIVAKLR